MSLSQPLSRRTRVADEFPVHLTLFERNLAVHIYLHEIDTQQGYLSCWSYVTDGLRAHGQKEIVFTLRRDQGEAPENYPTDPLDILGLIYDLAQQRRLVDVGGLSEFRADFLGFPALAYTPPQALVGVETPFPGLTAIALTREELQAVRAFGLTRVMARLGKAYRFYPCPPWTDRTRASLSFAEPPEKSLMTGTRLYHVRGLRVCRVGDHFVLRLLPGEGQNLSEVLSEHASRTNHGISLLAELDPAANGCLAWEPSQARPLVIVPPGSDGSSPSGCFLTFIPGPQESLGRIIEDGFIVALTEPSWQVLLNALSLEKPISIAAPKGEYGLTIEWDTNTYTAYTPAT